MQNTYLVQGNYFFQSTVVQHINHTKKNPLNGEIAKIFSTAVSEVNKEMVTIGLSFRFAQKRGERR